MSARSSWPLIAPMILALSTAACGLPPRPSALGTADQASRSPASLEASKLAPQAWQRAEQLRSQAEQAWKQSESATASILAERALVAYQRAAVLADLARAAKVAETARQQLADNEKQLRALDAEQARLVADIEALEVRINVLKDAEPVAASGRADPARQAARLAAARSIALDARLLCVAARLVDAHQAGLDEADAEVQKLEASLTPPPRTAPIDEARRVRARCLSALTRARRSSSSAPSTGAADVVLEQVSSKTTLLPVRDDRGVVVSIGADAINSAQSPARAALATLGQIAAANPQFPLLLVAHARQPGAPADLARARAAAEALSKQLAAAGVAPERMHIEQAGTAQALASPGRIRPSSTERIELVFISPGT